MTNEAVRRRFGRRAWIGAGAAAGLVAACAVAFVMLQNPESGALREGAGAPGRMAFAGQRAPSVSLARVTTAPIEQTLTAIGTGRALQSVVLNAEVSGVVEQILVEPGDEVDEGEPLIRLERRQQEIALARARADFNIARTNADRFAGLVRDEAASALEQEAAQNTLIAAEAQLRQAEYDLQQRMLRAPFSGVIGLIDLDVGDLLAVGETVTTIDDVSRIIVDFIIPETAASYVSRGLPVKATAQSARGRVFEGEIRFVDSRIDPASRTQRVQAVLDNPDRALKPGATFSIELAVPGREALVVPNLALQWDRAGSYVWRAGPEGRAERTPAAILRRTAEFVLVEGPLARGEYVVAEGADLVRAGSPLPVPHEAAAEDPDDQTSY